MYPGLQAVNGYVAGGWRFGKLTPLMTYSEFQPQLSLFNAANTFKSEAVSLRYDIASNIALKAQMSRASAGDTEYWLAANAASSAQVNVFGRGADFVF